MIICSQISKLDTDVLSPAFCRAQWTKKSKKVMVCLSKHHPPRTFTGLPKSPIRFDPDRIAQFIDRDVLKEFRTGELGQTYEIAKLYLELGSMTRIEKQRGYHREEVRREIKKALRIFIEVQEASFEGTELENVKRGVMSTLKNSGKIESHKSQPRVGERGYN